MNATNEYGDARNLHTHAGDDQVASSEGLGATAAGQEAAGRSNVDSPQSYPSIADVYQTNVSRSVGVGGTPASPVAHHATGLDVDKDAASAAAEGRPAEKNIGGDPVTAARVGPDIAEKESTLEDTEVGSSGAYVPADSASLRENFGPHAARMRQELEPPAVKMESTARAVDSLAVAQNLHEKFMEATREMEYTKGACRELEATVQSLAADHRRGMEEVYTWRDEWRDQLADVVSTLVAKMDTMQSTAARDVPGLADAPGGETAKASGQEAVEAAANLFESPAVQRLLSATATASAMAAAAQLRETYERGKDTPRGTPVRMEVDRDFVFSFAGAARHPMLKDSAADVTHAAVQARMPDVNSRDDMRNFYDGFGAKVLLHAFTDVVSQARYAELRKALVLGLTTLAHVTLQQRGDVSVAEGTVARYLRAAIEASAEKQGAYAKIRMVQEHVVARETCIGEGTVTAEEMLEYMDKEFVSPTRVAKEMEVQKELDGLTFESGILPSTMIVKLRSTLARKYVNDRDRVDQEVRMLVMQKVNALAEEHAVMRELNSKIMDVHFHEEPLDAWITQFKNFESQTSFQNGLAAIARPGGGGAKRATVPKVNALLGNHPREFDSPSDETPTATEMDGLREFLGSLMGMIPGDLRSTAAPTTGERDTLRRLIAAVSGGGGSGGNSRDAAWVEKNGVTGYAAPYDKDRPSIHVGEVAKALGWAVDPSCPKSPKSLVGPECPCNNHRGVPRENWFYHPMSAEFRSGKSEYTRIKPPDLKLYGYYHGLGKCSVCYEHAHMLARKDTSQVHILKPLPKDAVDCITTA